MGKSFRQDSKQDKYRKQKQNKQQKKNKGHTDPNVAYDAPYEELPNFHGNLFDT